MLPSNAWNVHPLRIKSNRNSEILIHISSCPKRSYNILCCELVYEIANYLLKVCCHLDLDYFSMQHICSSPFENPSAQNRYPRLILFAVYTLQTNIKSRTQWRKPLNRFGESKEKIFHSFSNKHRIVNIMSPNLSVWMKEIKLFLWWIIPKIKCFEKCQNYKSRKGPPFYQLETLHNKDPWKIM